MLESALDDALGGRADQNHLIACLRDVGVLHLARLLPRHALQYVRLGARRYLVRPSVILNLDVEIDKNCRAKRRRLQSSNNELRV